jgi:hypothetical protein
MLGQFRLGGKAWQVGKDAGDGDLEQDRIALASWSATLRSNHPIQVPVPDGSDIDYIDQRTVTVLPNGDITEDGVNPGISLSAHDADKFGSRLQWTIVPNQVTLVSGRKFKPRAWTFNAPLAGEDTNIGALAPVVGVPLLPAPDAVPWGAVSGKPEVIAAGDDVAEVWGVLGTVPSGNLPSYVDDVLEFANSAAFPVTGATGKIYVAVDTGDNYRWSGSSYIRVGDRVTSTGITDASAPGRAVLTGTADAGRNAMLALGLVQAAKNPDLLVTGAITVDGNDLITTASVVWPDGSPGTLTITSRDANNAVLAYNITYGSPVTKTYTQPTITRNTNGAATNVPTIVVS